MENKKILDLQKKDIVNIFIILGVFFCLYYFKDSTGILVHIILLSILVLFLFLDNLTIQFIMIGCILYLSYEISKQRQYSLIFWTLILYVLTLFFQKVLEKYINWFNNKLENKFIDNILEKFNWNKFLIIYFFINFVPAILHAYLIYNLINFLPKEKFIDLSFFLGITVIFVEAVFNTLYKKEEKKLNNVENRFFFLLICKACNLVFFIMYTIFYFFIYIN